MEKGKRTVIKYLLILISVYFIDGGRSLSVVSDNLQILIVHNQVRDIEIPHQQHFVNFTDDEKWLRSISFDFSTLHLNSEKFLFTFNSSPQEFFDSIWQPPKNA
jgi:hypothetical protein